MSQQEVGTGGLQSTDGTESPGFVHLHLHTEYSLLDGGNRIPELVARVKKLGMESVAVTDHGNVFGAVEFYLAARKAGIKPILGIEAYVAVGDRRDRVKTGIADGGFHLVLLAETNVGWSNLLRLTSDAFLNGFYYKPRMDKSTLQQWGQGLIAINGHLGSSLAHHLLLYEDTGRKEHWEAAREEAAWHRDAFGVNEDGSPCFYIELQRNGVQLQDAINPHLIRLAGEMDLPLVCDNDAHFLSADDWPSHDTLCCISMQKQVQDQDRLLYPRALYVKSPSEMQALFQDVPDAVANTCRIADRCHVKLDLARNHAPVVRIRTREGALPLDVSSARNMVMQFENASPIGSTQWFEDFCHLFVLEPYSGHGDDAATEEIKRDCDVVLQMLAEAGAIWRYGVDGVTGEKRERLERELKILSEKMISAYFLICWDVVSWARKEGIPANARGSGVGTMIGYVLGLSNACPVKYGLLFERFTDPDRAEYPDIDIDICQDGRPRVIEYVRRTYGHVAQIITFGRLKARAAIKDVARVQGLLPAEGQRLANLVPSQLNITIDEALRKDPDFETEYKTNKVSREVIDMAKRLEGHARHAGIHAAGVVIATQPLDSIVPLCRVRSGDDNAITQWDGPTCEKAGLLKMDFLGLRTLSTVECARRLIAETFDEEEIFRATGTEWRGKSEQQHPLDLERLDFCDPRVFDLFRRCDTSGVFQFESEGMRRLLGDMQPDRLEDLIAANALFRPGPMELISNYCARKHGREDVPCTHEIVDRYTAETYGIMVYQEQVMQIVHELGDIPLRDAYTLIKAISKKKKRVIDANRPRFIESARQRGLGEQAAGELFDLILKFAGYGFNKSHSTGYAILAYQTAYLKTYFPAQYMAAVLTYESGAKKVEAWAPYLHDCRETRWPDHSAESPHIGIQVHPPDINRSQADFSVVFDQEEPLDACHGHIRFGLGAIKGIGHGAISGILKERDRGGAFANIFDFCERVPSAIANRAALDALVKSGAFDSLHGADDRAAVVAAIPEAMRAGQSSAQDRATGQEGLFVSSEEDDDEWDATIQLPDVPPFDMKTMLEHERSMLGMCLSGHMLDEHEPLLSAFATGDIQSLAELPEESKVVLGGVISRVHHTRVRRGRSAGQRMARITLQDRHGEIDGVIFSETFQRDASTVNPDMVVMVIGRLDRSRGSTQVIVDRIIPIERAPIYLGLYLDLHFCENCPEHELRNAMQAAFEVLQQAAATPPPGGGRPASVRIHLAAGNGADKPVLLNSRGLHVVPDRGVLEQLEEILGADSVQVIGEGDVKGEAQTAASLPCSPPTAEAVVR